MHNAAACLDRVPAGARRELADRRGTARAGAVEPHGLLRAEPASIPGDDRRRDSRVRRLARRLSSDASSARIYAALDEVPRHRPHPSRMGELAWRDPALRPSARWRCVSLDLQECPKMDVAIAAFVRGALASMSAHSRRRARSCLIGDSCSPTTGRPWRKAASAPVSTQLLARQTAPAHRACSARRVARRCRPSSGRRRAAVSPSGRAASRPRKPRRAHPRPCRAGPAAPARRDAIVDLYGELALCLETNTPWPG